MVLRPNLTHLLSYACLSLLTLTINFHPTRQEPAPGHFKFQWLGSGKTMKGGVEVSFARYSSENGILVERFQEDHRTHKAALAELGRLQRRASKVIQDGYKTDAHGKRIGPRVELSFGRSGGRPKHTVVAWTDGSNLLLLRS